MEETLKNLGFRKNEIKIYLYLLKKGKTTTGKIIKETQISNSRVYETLNSLIKKGLVNYTIEKRGKNFQASDPHKFLEIEQERKTQLEKIIPDLEKLKQTKEFETNSAIYEGFEGFKTVYKKILNDCPKNETIQIIGFSSKIYENKKLKNIIKNFNAKTALNNQKLKIILDENSKEDVKKGYLNPKFSAIKYMPKGYISPFGINTFSDYIYIFLWEEKPFVFMIKNKLIAQSFKQYHNFLWEIN